MRTLFLVLSQLICVRRVVARCTASDEDLERRWQALTNAENDNIIEIYSATLGSPASDTSQSCQVASWSYPDKAILLSRRAGPEGSSLPTKGPAILFCPLHAALAYLNTLEPPAEPAGDFDQARGAAGGDSSSGGVDDGGPEVTIFLGRGTFNVNHPLPVVSRSVTILGADAEGLPSKSKLRELAGEAPLASMHCLGEPPASAGGYEVKFKRTRTTFPQFLPEEDPKGVLYHLTSVLRGSKGSGDEGLLRIASSGCKVGVFNVGFFGGSAERGAGVYVLAEPEAIEAADVGAVKVGDHFFSASSSWGGGFRAPGREASSWPVTLGGLKRGHESGGGGGGVLGYVGGALASLMASGLEGVDDWLTRVGGGPYSPSFKFSNGGGGGGPGGFAGGGGSEVQQFQQGQEQERYHPTLLMEEGGVDMIEIGRMKRLKTRQEVTELTLQNCDFVDNGAAYGGALYVGTGRVTVSYCNIIGNTARRCGGAVYMVQGFADLQLEYVVVKKNHDRCGEPLTNFPANEPKCSIPMLGQQAFGPIIGLPRDEHAISTPNSIVPRAPRGHPGSANYAAPDSEGHVDARGFMAVGDPVTDAYAAAFALARGVGSGGASGGGGRRSGSSASSRRKEANGQQLGFGLAEQLAHPLVFPGLGSELVRLLRASPLSLLFPSWAFLLLGFLFTLVQSPLAFFAAAFYFAAKDLQKDKKGILMHVFKSGKGAGKRGGGGGDDDEWTSAFSGGNRARGKKQHGRKQAQAASWGAGVDAAISSSEDGGGDDDTDAGIDNAEASSSARRRNRRGKGK